MKKLTKHITVILLIMTYLITANASEVNKNVEKMNIKEINSLIYRLSDNYIKHTDLGSETELMTAEAASDIQSYIVNNDIGGELRDVIVDFTYPDNSSTGDTVIMANTKVKYDDYDKLYMFEYHVNADGKIYGFNAWVY